MVSAVLATILFRRFRLEGRPGFCSDAHTSADQPICRFHAASTLKLMNAYRIGYILEPWTNLTPPIRGGIYKKIVIEVEEDTNSSTDTDVGSDSDCISVGSSVTSLESLASIHTACDVPKIKASHDSEDVATAEGLRHRRKKDIPQAPTLGELSPDAYIASTIRGEIEDGIRAYPSLDAETQRSINLKYRNLHQRVKAEGFYECRYIEYAKEATRYSILFISFILALRQGWYMTSAALLGLFWVCKPFMLTDQTDKRSASDHVHSSRCWSSRNHAQFRCRYAYRHVYC